MKLLCTWVVAALCLSAVLGGCAATEANVDGSLGDVDGGDAAAIDGGPDGAPSDASVPDACVVDPGGEICDGLDNDCDGDTDEGYGVGDPCDGADSDLCAEGELACDGAGGVRCDDTTSDSIEICNGADDDCDDTTDEGFPVGQSCDGADSDLCAEGTIMCDPTGATLCSDATGNSLEICDGVDNDCDGSTDEGFALGTGCDGADGDLCAEGVIVCNAAGAAVCGDTTATNVELCDGVDNDCDGATDEGWNVGATCDGDDGDACIEGTIVCAMGGMATVCSDTTSTTTELCNAVDDDCDGTNNEGFDVGGACTSGIGACAVAGTKVCAGDGLSSVCSATAGTPQREFCGDGLDSDCSGGVDPVCPTNDRPAGAIDVSAGGVFTTDLTFAHDDALGACSSGGGRDVFYQFTIAAPQIVYLDTFGSNYDSVIRVHAGACATTLGAFQVCGDDACSVQQTQLAADLAAAGTYCVVVDQFSESQTNGATTLRVVFGGRRGTRLAGPGTVTGNTCTTGVSLSGACGTSDAAPEVPYYFLTCPSQTADLSAGTCGGGTTYDSVLYYREGNGMASDSTQVCNDDNCNGGATCTGGTTRASSFVTPISGAGLRWIIVDGFGTGCSNCGPYSLAVTF